MLNPLLVSYEHGTKRQKRGGKEKLFVNAHLFLSGYRTVDGPAHTKPLSLMLYRNIQEHIPTFKYADLQHGLHMEQKRENNIVRRYRGPQSGSP